MSAGPTEIPRSTLLELQCKKTADIFVGDVGKISLSDLAEWWQADDYLTPGSFTASYYNSQGATEFDFEAWEDRSTHAQAAKVHGKLRLLKMRVLVPPAPMCPATTKIDQWCHVWSQDDQVIKETSTISWDVPYGDSFKVVIRDTFTVDGGTMQMKRTWGLEWLKSTMMKSMIESNVPSNLIKDAEKMAAFMRTYNPGAASGDASQVARVLPSPSDGTKGGLAQRCNMLCCSSSRSTTEEITFAEYGLDENP